MQENPVKLPPGVVQDQPPDEESHFARQLGTTARVTWPWLKSKFGKQPPREEASDREYWNGKWGKLTIEVRPFDANGQWLHNLNQEFTPDGLRDAQKYGFELMRDLPEVDGFWVDARLEKYWTDKGQHQTMRMMTLGRYERARQERNPRKRAAGLTEGADDANRRREGSGRFLKSTPCDFCGKSCAAEHFTDDRACGGGDGPGFYLCGKATCERARAKLEREQGFPALKQHYIEQRRKNDAMDRGKAKAFLDGPRGTEIQLANLRRQQDIVARRLSEATEDYKIEMLQKKERALQEQIDKLVFGDEQVPNHAAVHYNLAQLDDDIDAALDHMSDFEVHLNKSNISVTDPMMIPMRQLGEYDDLSSWLDLDSGSDEQEVKDFRGVRWAALAGQWTSPQQMPPIVIVEAPNAVAIADGRGRVNYATAMGWDEIPAVIVTPSHEPNHAAVHYVWLIDGRGVPLETEGPYGPMSLDRASAYARIGAKEGDHDRVVSTGREIMSDGFEIVRRYRRGTGERVL